MTAVGGESLFLQSDWVQMTMTKDIGLMLVLERRTDTFSLLIKKNGEPKNTLTLKKGGTKNIHKTCTMNLCATTENNRLLKGAYYFSFFKQVE